jgi:protein TonB
MGHQKAQTREMTCPPSLNSSTAAREISHCHPCSIEFTRKSRVTHVAVHLHRIEIENAMFDLITGRTGHIPSTPTLPLLISVGAQVATAGTLLAVSMLWVTGTLPEVPTMMAFVAAPPSPPPPPPPAPAAKREKPSVAKPTPTVGLTAPVDVPARIEPEPADDEGFDEGVEGGVAGGVPGGVVGGIPGGVLGGVPQELPPPPPARPRAPVRVGGNITTPALIRRVEPIYPDVAQRANIEGVAILEAIIDEEGRVADVRVLRTASGVLDRAALTAVRQWQYTPLVLNGIPVRFILTVTLSFQLETSSE